MSLRSTTLKWGLLPTLALALLCASVLPAAAQPRKKDKGEPATAAEAFHRASDFARDGAQPLDR